LVDVISSQYGKSNKYASSVWQISWNIDYNHKWAHFILNIEQNHQFVVVVIVMFTVVAGHTSHVSIYKH
jgi:hypothetical protein